MFLADVDASHPFLTVLLPFIPWALVLVFLYFVAFRGLRGQQRKAAENAARARQHWDAVEAKLDRLVELAERRDSNP